VHTVSAEPAAQEPRRFAIFRDLAAADPLPPDADEE
jgi:hypothetical protein